MTDMSGLNGWMSSAGDRVNMGMCYSLCMYGNVAIGGWAEGSVCVLCFYYHFNILHLNPSDAAVKPFLSFHEITPGVCVCVCVCLSQFWLWQR